MHTRSHVGTPRRFTVVAVAAAVACIGLAASTLRAGATVGNPGPLTITVHDGTLGTPLGDFTPLSGTLVGTVSASGALSMPQASMTFPSFDVALTYPIETTVTVTPVAESDFTGNVDPDSGLVTIAGSLTTEVTLPDFGLTNCPLGPLAVSLSTGTAGGSPYGAGAATLVDSSFVIPAIAPGAAGCAGFEGIINSILGFPTAPGASALTLPMTFTPAVTGASSTSSTQPTSTTSTSTSTTSTSTTSTTVVPPSTTTTVGTPADCSPGFGYGDKNHCHSGPPGRAATSAPCDPGTAVASLSRRAPAPDPIDATVNVDLDHSAGPVNANLTGAVWNSGNSIAPLQPVHPSIIRIDGSLQDRSQGPNQLDLQPLLSRVAQVRAIGAEPLVILSYMPRWLGAPRAGTTKDATRVAPYDLDLWEALVTNVVRTLATAPEPAYMFEVWNEPDIPNFWQDTPQAFTAMAVRTHEAVANVERETGKPIEVGGPAAAFGLNPNMVDYLQSVAAAHLPLDFVSWHKYANSPFLGPDGPEGNLPIDLYNALAKRNPNSTPLDFSREISDIRSTVGAALAGSGLDPRFILDEWNVSAGGYDVRHDNAEGASLIAGILIEMERASLDEAAFYRAISSGSNHIGDWGLVYSDGTPKPSWWVFQAWSTMTGYRLPTQGDAPSAGLWARASRNASCVNVLLANFVATGAPARTVQINLNGDLPRCHGPLTTTLATLDSSSTSLANSKVVRLDRGSITVPMASQSVALLRATCT